MTRQKNRQAGIIITDAGPLISLARADALDILLVFKDDVSLVYKINPGSFKQTKDR